MKILRKVMWILLAAAVMIAVGYFIYTGAQV